MARKPKKRQTSSAARISATEAARNFSELLNRVQYRRHSFLVERAHARLGADLARRGVTIGAHDLIVGASALALGYSVITRDRRSFPKIPDLDVLVV